MPKNLNSDITKLITKYLSIREHSKLELKTKLSSKGFEDGEIAECLHEFSLKNIQSDDRFTEEFIRSRLKKNKGPRLISSELSARGISDTLINEKLFEISNDIWLSGALSALEKKINNAPLSDMNDKKIYSFLIGRGFDHKMIKYALNEYKNER